MDLHQAQEIALKHQKAMAKELLLQVVLVEIKKAVDASPGKLDDAVYLALEKAVKEAVEKI